MKIKYLCCCLIVSGCFSEQEDIQQFIDNVDKNTIRQIESLPEITEFTHVSYTGFDKPSPFKYAQFDDLPQDNIQSLPADCFESQYDQHEFLESTSAQINPELVVDEFNQSVQLPLKDLIFKGTIGNYQQRWALMESRVDGLLYRVAIGSPLGLFNGRVVQITDQQIHLQQQIPDGQGCYKNRQLVMMINTPLD